MGSGITALGSGIEISSFFEDRGSGCSIFGGPGPKCVTRLESRIRNLGTEIGSAMKKKTYLVTTLLAAHKIFQIQPPRDINKTALSYQQCRRNFRSFYLAKIALGARGLYCAVSGLGQCLYCDPREKPLKQSAVSLIAPSQWEACLNPFSPAFGLDS